MLGFLIGTIVAVALAAVTLPLTWIQVHDRLHLVQRVPPEAGILTGAAILAVVVVALRPSILFRVVIHESAHTLFCLALGVPIKGFMASENDGGFVQHMRTGPVRTVLILIAPYTLPVLLAPALVFLMFADAGLPRQIATALVGFFTVIHLVHLTWNIRHN